jgi:hypothetical protein
MEVFDSLEGVNGYYICRYRGRTGANCCQAPSQKIVQTEDGVIRYPRARMVCLRVSLMRELDCLVREWSAQCFIP